jgi:Ca2+-binding EF-hand superfamily protein
MVKKLYTLKLALDWTLPTGRKTQVNKISNLLIFLSAAVILLASGFPPATALTPTREQVKKSWEKRFQDLDRNRDGKISLAEYLAFLGADHPRRRQFLEYEFRKYDRNGDGFITREEHWAPVSLADEFRGLDKNQDGRISPDEFLQGEKMFRSLDRNHDGFITWYEYSDAYGPKPTKR